jgi:hypothetical protein
LVEKTEEDMNAISRFLCRYSAARQKEKEQRG